MATRKIIITAAQTGAFHGKEANPNIPLTPKEIADSAYDCYNAGASIIHIHARDKEGLSTNDPKVSRITIEVLADQRHAELLCNQLRKLLPVHSVKLLQPENSLRRELILLKVSTPNTEACNRVMQVASIFRASIIDVSASTLTIAMIGEESKNEAIVGLVEQFGILELVRTGMVALERGTDTIYEATKEKGEFDYGKNVL